MSSSRPARSTPRVTRRRPRRCWRRGCRTRGSRSSRTSSAPGRTSLVARWGVTDERPSLCLTGHLDTVPLGRADWSVDAFSGETDGDRLFGRGTSDMKGGTAAIVVAAERVAALGGSPSAGLELVLCAGEETGCEGALALADSGLLGTCGALLVAEPTTNYPCVAHKGVVWADAVARGKTAHGSMPHLGENAIYKLARAILAARGPGARRRRARAARPADRVAGDVLRRDQHQLGARPRGGRDRRADGAGDVGRGLCCARWVNGSVRESSWSRGWCSTRSTPTRRASGCRRSSR